jgi:dihydroorotase
MSDYDLLLKNGHVIDAKNGIDGRNDVAVKDGKIAVVGLDLAGTADTSVDVSGQYVSPGLLDIHLHVYGGFNAWVFPDPHCLPQGVTTCMDTGGAGYLYFEDFKTTIIEPSITRVLALVNIVGAGMIGKPEQNTEDMDPKRCADMIKRYPEHIVGAKSAHFGGPGWESACGAIEAARLSDTLVMIDFSPRATRTYEEMLGRFSPGDIHTHCYSTRTPLLNPEGQINDYVWQARQRGVYFDLGHGNQSFFFPIATAAMEQGFLPDSISTDLHRRSRMLPNAMMTVVMSKMLALGMSVAEVIHRSTWRPAQVIQRPELGHLSVGAEADIAVLSIEEGSYGFVDARRTRMEARRKFECRMTVRAGEIVWDVDGQSMPHWSDVPLEPKSYD